MVRRFVLSLLPPHILEFLFFIYFFFSFRFVRGRGGEIVICVQQFYNNNKMQRFIITPLAGIIVNENVRPPLLRSSSIDTYWDHLERFNRTSFSTDIV